MKANDYADLARLMQRIESYVIIENACQRMMDEFPDIPIFTVHDAVYTIEPHRQTVRDVIWETFRDVLGVNVAFKGDKKAMPAPVLAPSPSGLFLPAETMVC